MAGWTEGRLEEAAGRWCAAAPSRRTLAAAPLPHDQVALAPGSEHARATGPDGGDGTRRADNCGAVCAEMMVMARSAIRPVCYGAEMVATGPEIVAITTSNSQ